MCFGSRVMGYDFLFVLRKGFSVYPCPRTCYVDQSSLKLTEVRLSAFASLMLELKVCVTTPGPIVLFVVLGDRI